MKLITTTALCAASAASLSMPQPRCSRLRQPRSSRSAGARPQRQDHSRPRRRMKALVDLQNAVKQERLANIPAKVAAAQAVATTKEDRYLIGALQLKAAIAAKDNAAMAAAIEAIAASGYYRRGTGYSELYGPRRHLLQQ